jgi:hypothetical protein
MGPRYRRITENDGLLEKVGTNLFLKKQSSGMWRRVDVVLTDVSEERIASIFRVKGKNKKIRKRRNSESRYKQTAFFIVTAVKTSNLTNLFLFLHYLRYCISQHVQQNWTASAHIKSTAV